MRLIKKIKTSIRNLIIEILNNESFILYKNQAMSE